MEIETFADTLRADISDDGVLRLTKVNAASGYGISKKMLSALKSIFTDLKSHASIRAVIIDAEGNALQNGAVMVAEVKPNIQDLTQEDFAEIVAIGHELGHMIADLPIPVIGLARGGALGGGLELLLRTDYAFCIDEAEFSFPEVTLGFVAAWGGTQLAGRYMPFRKAQELLLTGLPIDGAKAEEYGLVTRSFASSDALEKHLAELLDQLRHCSPASFQWTKKCLAAIWTGHLADGEKMELEAEVEAMGSGDFIKALGAFGQGHYFDYSNDTVGRRR